MEIEFWEGKLKWFNEPIPDCVIDYIMCKQAPRAGFHSSACVHPSRIIIETYCADGKFKLT